MPRDLVRQNMSQDESIVSTRTLKKDDDDVKEEKSEAQKQGAIQARKMEQDGSAGVRRPGPPAVDMKKKPNPLLNRPVATGFRPSAAVEQ